MRSKESERGALDVYGDASYGVAALLERIEAAGAEANVKVQPPSPPGIGAEADTFCIPGVRMASVYAQATKATAAAPAPASGNALPASSGAGAEPASRWAAATRSRSRS